MSNYKTSYKYICIIPYFSKITGCLNTNSFNTPTPFKCQTLFD